MATKVSQATIDKIKKMGMTAALKSAPGASAEMTEGLRRMYGQRRLDAATKTAKPAQKITPERGAGFKSTSPYPFSGTKNATPVKRTAPGAISGASRNSAPAAISGKKVSTTTAKKSTTTAKSSSAGLPGVTRGSSSTPKKKAPSASLAARRKAAAAAAVKRAGGRTA